MRKRCTWVTIASHKDYEFQTNEYDERRVLLLGRTFRTFHGQNAHRDARRIWQIITEVC